MDSVQLETFESGYIAFLSRLFDGQSTYKVKILSATVVSNDMNTSNDDHTLYASVVVSGQYKEGSETNLSAKDQFHQILVHISNKFNIHLLDYWKQKEQGKVDDNDPYGNIDIFFSHLDSAIFLESTTGKVTSEAFKMDANKDSSSNNTNKLIFAFVGIFVGFTILGVVLFTIIKIRSSPTFGKKTSLKYLYNLGKINNSQNLITTPEISVSKPNEIGNGDTYSFSDASNQQNKIKMKKFSPRDKNSRFSYNPIPMKEEIESSSIQINDTHKNDPGTVLLTTISEESSLLSSDDASTSINKDSGIIQSVCYAPPGKLGVAIDTINGKPVVHRIKEGSPLYGVLRRLDVIMSIDDIDTSSMSAADVTYLMVKRMHTKRKIVFV
eukprot:CAMPEP_0184868520 /NCGR_PEP_ID=MMETSP0580-20130426/30717_1 /TAXON_ID=1118495 /ORGANISM="Dactyliosolen fragilissimus" /LENGTH=381 /DNA_ID=CAMNT_0027369467 /DNA_START=301 /DNA_END=1443 /DNA_ORIENTATION=-